MAYKSTMLFDVMNNILASKSADLYKSHVSNVNFKDCSTFMLCRYMTMSPSEEVRRIILENYRLYEKLDPKVLYRILLVKMPKQKSGFIKYLR